jgi:hypothetical protein
MLKVMEDRNEQGQCRRYSSRILPLICGAHSIIAEILPVLYLRGLATGEFHSAL